MPDKEPDRIIAVVRSDRDLKCPVCTILREAAEEEGHTKDVVFVNFTLSSELEKKLNKVSDSQAAVKVIDK